MRNRRVGSFVRSFLRTFVPSYEVWHGNLFVLNRFGSGSRRMLHPPEKSAAVLRSKFRTTFTRRLFRFGFIVAVVVIALCTISLLHPFEGQFLSSSFRLFSFSLEWLVIERPSFLYRRISVSVIPMSSRRDPSPAMASSNIFGKNSRGEWIRRGIMFRWPRDWTRGMPVIAKKKTVDSRKIRAIHGM